MAGYIMNLDNESSLQNCFHHGIYSTKISPPKYYANAVGHTYPGYWKTPQEGTFADFATMKQGDNIYFFIKRKIYGIGTLVNINTDCKFNNFPDSSIPTIPLYSTINPDLLFDFGPNSINNRWICTFIPSPYFFTCGVDMDDVLSSNPSKFKILRAFWKLSFIKIDDEENKALKDVILKYNQNYLTSPSTNAHFSFNNTTHINIQNKLSRNTYNFNSDVLLLSCSRNTAIQHEMALEAGTLHQLSNNYYNTLSIFGTWDYLSHQVIASPFKPIDYMDKMDIFGYRYIPNFPGTISKYLVIELKSDSAQPADIEQVLKYVDWVNQEYSFGDYSMIDAFLVAKNIDASVILARDTLAQRNFIIGRRPARFGQWTNLKLVEYNFNINTNEINFTLI